jgi:hypothetical protein
MGSMPERDGCNEKADAQEDRPKRLDRRGGSPPRRAAAALEAADLRRHEALGDAKLERNGIWPFGLTEPGYLDQL